MSFNRYIKDKLSTILINTTGLFVISLYLLTIDVSFTQLLIILLGWILVLFFYFTIDFYIIKKRYMKWLKAFNNLDKKYLIAELIGKPNYYIECLFYQFLKKANKSMMEEINLYKTKEREYEEYIEQWVHEMKTPISAISLICENRNDEASKRIINEINKMNHLVMQTLFYAKSEFLHKDLFIKEINLNDLIHQVILDNKFLLQEKNFQLEIDENFPKVKSDKKWLTYIINQIILNSIKYSNKNRAYLKISSITKQDKIILNIKDLGKGISQSDLPRVFDKGFTGHNRGNHHSTGMGLYLCKKLCNQLNIDILISSEENVYTNISLIFTLTKL